MPKIQSSSVSWLYSIIAIDLFLVIMTMSNNYFADVENIRFIAIPFNLAAEMNLSVWWSGICLATAGILSYENYSLSKDSSKNAWLALSILLLGLSLDEVGSLHERIGGWLNLLPFGIACAALFGYAFYKLINSPGNKKAIVLITIAFVLYGSVALQEYLEHNIDWQEWMLALRVGIEEGTELFATLIILYAITSRRGVSITSFSAIIPRPYKMKYIHILLSIGLLLHLAIYFSFPTLSDPSLSGASRRGNTLVWLPMIQFLIIFFIARWISKETLKNPFQWKIIALVSLLSSAAMMWDLLYFIPALDDLIPGKAFTFILYLIPPLLILMFSIQQNIINFRSLLPLVLTGSVLIISILYYKEERNFTLAAWSIVSIFYGYFLMLSIKNFYYESNTAKNN